MKTIYICHPFANDPQGNIKKVTEICKSLKNVCVPLAPHLLLPHYIDEDTERELALEHGIELLKRCDELWIYGDFISAGMRDEIDYAIFHNMTVVVCLKNAAKVLSLWQGIK